MYPKKKTMSSLFTNVQQLRNFNSGIRTYDETGAGEPSPQQGFGKQGGDGEEGGQDSIEDPTTFLSKSAKKRSKKRAAKKGAMNIVDFCNGFGGNGGGDADSTPKTADEGQAVTGAAKCPPVTQSAPSSNNSYASIVSGKGSQDSFFMETDAATEMEAGGPPAPTVLEMGKVVVHHIGQGLPEKELKEQETQAGGSGVVAKKDVAVQTDLGKTEIIVMDKRAMSTMTDADQKMETEEKAVGAKLCGCEDEGKVPSSVEFLGDQFRFESALTIAVGNMGINFAEGISVGIGAIGVESDVENYESSESEYMFQSQF